MTSAQLTWNSGKSAERERAKETLEHFSSAKNLYSGELCRININSLSENVSESNLQNRIEHFHF